MRIVLVSETHSKKMGYAPGCLAKALASLGAEVHLITLKLFPYYRMEGFRETYGGFAEETFPDQEDVDGYRIHYLDARMKLGHMKPVGLLRKLRSLRPDIVQTFITISWIPMEAAWGTFSMNYALFTGTHTAATVFPLAREPYRPWSARYLRSLVVRALPGRLVSFRTHKCYAVTRDALEVGVRFFGVPRSKIETLHLGVDLDVFYPPRSQPDALERERVRGELGFRAEEIVCLHSGKLTEEKNALLLGKAVEQLRRAGHPYRLLVIGEGVQKDALAACEGTVMRPFMPFQELGRYYRASDLGAWPTTESTSTLDAMACGLPVVVSDCIADRSHVEGNGLVFAMNDLEDLKRKLLDLGSEGYRRALGEAGAQRMAREYSWVDIARRRMRDYEASLSRTSAPVLPRDPA